MKFYALSALSVTAILVIGGMVYRRWTDQGDSMSEDWIERQRREGRVKYDGVRIAFPIDKVRNDSAWVQTRQLRRRA